MDKRTIEQELRARGISLPSETAPVIKRVIHTAADFEYVDTLRFTENVVALGTAAMKQGVIVTDTNMACAGISKPALSRLGGGTHCFMAEEARRQDSTRAAVPIALALETWDHPVLPVGNAPTALLRIVELLEEGKHRTVYRWALSTWWRARSGCWRHVNAAVFPLSWHWDARAAAMWRRPFAMPCCIVPQGSDSATRGWN